MSSITARDATRGFSLQEYMTCLTGIVWREGLRFLHQRERFVSALVRPLVWLFIFAAGFRQVICSSELCKSAVRGHEARQHGRDQLRRIDALPIFACHDLCINDEIPMHRCWQLSGDLDRLVVW